MFTSADIIELASYRNVFFFFVIILLSIVAYHGTILWCIFLGLLIILFYYLLKRIFGEDEITDTESLDSIRNVRKLEEELQIVYVKWAAIGSPTIIKSDINLINFLYAIKPWKVYNSTAYESLITQIEKLMNEITTDKQSVARSACIDTFQSFNRLANFGPALTQLQQLTQVYVN